MTLELSPEDRDYIWQVVHHAVEIAGSHANLFANRLEFFEESGRIRFNWPAWMDSIRGFLEIKYGHNKANSLLFSILREIMAEPNYLAYKKRIENAQLEMDQQAS